MTAPEFELDLDREKRTGIPEAVFGPGKSQKQLEAIIQKLLDHDMSVIATRLDAAQMAGLELRFGGAPGLVFDHEAGIVWRPAPAPASAPTGRMAGSNAVQGGTLNPGESISPRSDAPGGSLVRAPVAVVSAGTSDFRTARETEITLRFLGVPFTSVRDVGVAGLHRLLSRVDELRKASVIIVIAGMDGALVPVTAGLVKAPVIAVPTSNGYGVSMGGVSALLTMMNSCAPGTAVVNIDNGFGAAVMAARIWTAP